ncbi:hypothetical protein RIF29_18535 [Crotalaria pallida]|uniref:Pectinesterase inhibitor domain-containing protein n=1 Tax=Crotalaria pallida TaxID=3830 RepID=A0AAN9FKL8_CROPI
MSSSKISFLLFTLSLILISHAPMPASGESLYERICKEYAKRTDDCLLILKSDSRIPTATNFLDLSNFILDFALKNGVEGQSFFSDLGKKNPSQAINQCAKVYYTSMVAAFKGAMSELKEHPDMARYQTSIATDDSKKCVSAIEGEKISNPEIDEINKVMSILCDAAFIAIVDYEK